MGFAEDDCPRFHSIRGLDANRRAPLNYLAVSGAVAVGIGTRRVVELLDVHIGRAGVVVGMTPAEVAIVTGPDIRSAENGEARNVHPFAAAQVRLIPLSAAEEGDVRIDHQQRVPAHASFGRHGPHV